MTNKPSQLALAAFATLWVGTSVGATLYDPGANTLPSVQGWTTAGAGFSQAVGGGVYVLDTTLGNAAMAGSALFNVATLDTAVGFTLDFSLRVLSEAHARDNRAGYSVIFTGTDPSHALELAFWNDRVFAYTASFARGSQALLATTSTTHYALSVNNNHYTLRGNSVELLSGALVNYGALGAPYTNPGFLFFGDDTSSARSRTELGLVSLTPIPEPSTVAMLLTGLLALTWRGMHRYARQLSKRPL